MRTMFVTGKMAEEQQNIRLWGGPECTIARIGERWRDQSVETGHEGRLDDLDRIAALGIRTLRYPILWERAVRDCDSKPDFSFADRQLERLKSLDIELIGGLVHHGSGPRGTDLLDPSFADRLADYAGQVAARFPWIAQWTPVNEPLTTARFAALYGHWYPHHRDERSFHRALVNQCLATARAMAAIRRTIPHATLVQTEDIGRTFATAPLRAQADHDNRRSWLSLDLLFGRVDEGHSFFAPLLGSGVARSELEELAAGAAKPDLIGVNHYLTSDRFLDHRVHLHPHEPVGGNGRQAYVDLEAVRVRQVADAVGIEPRLREVWQRYGAPIAITEVHHGCTHDEQLRWLIEVWDAAGRLAREGIDVRAVTLWSLFGNVDWRSLLTRDDGHYDSGAFDARVDPPRPTVVARAARALSAGERFEHPVLSSPGWWRRPERFYGACREGKASAAGAPLLVIGATGTLGRALARVARHRGLCVRTTMRAELDLEDRSSISAAIERLRPWAIVNAAGFVRVADAEHDRAGCFAANAGGVERLAEVAAACGIPLVGMSTDLVFDGTSGPYRESDACRPMGVYGASKLAAEQALLATASNLVVRSAAFFGPWDVHNFAWHSLRALRRGERVEARSDVFVSPTFVPDLCHALLDLVIDGAEGVWHLANQGRVSWHEFALRLARAAGVDCANLVATTGEAADTSLVSEHGALLRPIEAAIGDYGREFVAIEERLHGAAAGG